VYPGIYDIISAAVIERRCSDNIRRKYEIFPARYNVQSARNACPAVTRALYSPFPREKVLSK